jgi:phosphatidylinositol alpha-1,6-mannosyltransferase
VWWAARRSGARAVTYLHGLDIGNRHPLYGLGFVPCIRACERVWVNSRFTGELALARGIAGDRLRTLYPVACHGTDQDMTGAAAFRQRWSGHRVLLSAGRLVPRKGLPSFVEHVLPLILRQHPQTILAIAGDEAHGGIKRQDGEGQRIRQAAARAGVLDRLDWLGWLASDTLQAAYAAAEVLVFPVQHHPTDPEGFGMVAIEAAACGLPTVAYATGGVCEAVEHGLSGCLQPPGDVAGFARAVTALLETPSRVTASGCRRFAEQFSKELFALQVKGLLVELLQADAHTLPLP